MSLTRRGFASAIGALGLACGRASPPAPPASHPFAGYDVVDLTHPLGPSSPYIHVRGATFPFRRAPIATIPERGVYANRWELTEHIGTHVDAPCHFDEKAPCLEKIPLAELFAEVVVIELAARARANPDAEVSAADLSAWRLAHGPFPARSVVLLSSGWGARWPSQSRFANADEAGIMRFPGFSRAAVEELAAAPGVLGIGTDTFSIDPGNDAHFEGHRVLARAGKWALECLANLDRLPAQGCHLFVGAPKVELASGAPARVVAWVPRSHRK
ncbi:MAG: cyclase family protein [Myxococcales bacterium]|nr:MAG: cyclase family protein [Myxococcales bacterium]